MPAQGPKRNEQSTMKTSAGSYSRYGAAGKMGKWIIATRATERAEKTEIALNLLRWVEFITLIKVLSSKPSEYDKCAQRYL